MSISKPPGLRLDGQVEVGQLGESVNPIETTVTTVSARAGSGGLNLLESDDLVVDDTTVTVNRVDVDCDPPTVTADIRTDAVRSDIVTHGREQRFHRGTAGGR